MKKSIAVLMKSGLFIILALSVVMSFSCVSFGENADNSLTPKPTKTAADFDPSEYAVEDLLLIDKSIWKAIPVTQTGEVLFNDKGIYIEYKGIYEDSESSSWIIDLYMENNTEEAVEVSLLDTRFNRFDVGLYNGSFEMIADSVSRSSAKNRFIIKTEDFDIYEIDHLNSIDFTLKIYTGYSSDETIAEFPVKLIVDKDVNSSSVFNDSTYSTTTTTSSAADSSTYETTQPKQDSSTSSSNSSALDEALAIANSFQSSQQAAFDYIDSWGF